MTLLDLVIVGHYLVIFTIHYTFFDREQRWREGRSKRNRDRATSHNIERGNMKANITLTEMRSDRHRRDAPNIITRAHVQP